MTADVRKVLALVGIEVPPGPRRDNLVQWLAERLLELGPHVTAVDWATHDGSHYQLAVLDQWTAHAHTRFNLNPSPGRVLPASQSASGKADASWARLFLVDLLVAALGIILGWLVWTRLVFPS
jgi:hypothetical protein